MSAFGWLLLVGGVVAAVLWPRWVMGAVDGNPPLDEARDNGNAPVDECLFDIDIPLDDWKPTGWHDDLPLTATQRLDLYRQAEDIYHHTSVPVIPGREEN